MGDTLAVIFDMDGTLVDNATYHIEAWIEFAKRHGIGLDIETYHHKMNGRTMAGCLEVLFGYPLPPDEARQLGGEKEALYRELYRPHIQAIDGLQAFLESLAAAGIPCGVATSAPRVNVDFTLDGTGLRPWFSFIIDDSGVSRGKPDPEVFLKSAEGLGRPPAQCVVFEDAILGVEAGKRAGMKVAALSTTHPADHLTAADIILPDFRGLDAAWLKAFHEGKL